MGVPIWALAPLAVRRRFRGTPCRPRAAQAGLSISADSAGGDRLFRLVHEGGRRLAVRSGEFQVQHAQGFEKGWIVGRNRFGVGGDEAEGFE